MTDNVPYGSVTRTSTDELEIQLRAEDELNGEIIIGDFYCRLTAEEETFGQILSRFPNLTAGSTITLFDSVPSLPAELFQSLPVFSGDDGSLDLGLFTVSTDQKKFADRLVTFGGSADATDKEIVARHLAVLPLVRLERLEGRGTLVITARDSVVDYKPELRGKTPRNWESGTWDSVPGAAFGRKVVVATRKAQRFSSKRRIPPKGDGHGSQDLLFHEVAHTFHHEGINDGNFRRAREADFNSLPKYEQAAGNAGLEETFAESYAQYHSLREDMKSERPALYAYFDQMATVLF